MPLQPFSPLTVEDFQTPQGVAKLNEFLENLSRSFNALENKYTVSNLTTDRTYDANASSVAELADVLGSLIADLEQAKILPS